MSSRRSPAHSVPRNSPKFKKSPSNSSRGKAKISCQSCGKQYVANSEWGLHVCPRCEKFGPPKKKRVLKKPPTLVCYICGREFGTASLKIHQPQCHKKWTIEQSRLPPELRTNLKVPSAQVSETADLDVYNQEVEKVFEQNLSKCDLCGRTFKPDRLLIHQRSCTPEHPAKPVSSEKSSTPKQPVVQPTRASTALPKSRPSPGNSSPGKLGSLSPTTNSVRPKTSPLPVQNLKVGLVPCEKCGRTFAPDRVERHLRVCPGIRPPEKLKVTFAPEPEPVKQPKKQPKRKGVEAPKTNWRSQSSSLREVIEYGRQVSKHTAAGLPLSDLPPPPASENPDYVECPHCQRTFSKEASERHIPICSRTVNKPKPPPSKSQAPRPATSSPGMRSVRNPSQASLMAQHTKRPSTSPSTFNPSLHPPTIPHSKSTSLRPISPLRPKGKPAPYKFERSGSASIIQTKQSSPSKPLQISSSFCGICGKKFSSPSAAFCGKCGSQRVIA